MIAYFLFYITFRVKEDLLPNRETFLWFQPRDLGEFNVQCAEYCGMGHSMMRTKVEVVPEETFQLWLASKGKAASCTPTPARLASSE